MVHLERSIRAEITGTRAWRLSLKVSDVAAEATIDIAAEITLIKVYEAK